MRRVEILECTLRDGSYVIDFGFTADDTSLIALALEKAGARVIEVGHGIGLNASNAGEGKAAATDEEYLQAASSVLKKSKFGMFFIPGIGREEDLKMAAEYGMHFVRVGTNAPEVEKAEKYIKLAKDLGMEVSSNLMKSYTLSPQKLAEKAGLAESWGADVICMVDSAGGMLPDEVKKYVKTLQENLSCEIGFHGHDNLFLVHANCLAALEAGATRLDTSLQGIGRSGGNAKTEITVALLKKIGIDTGINLYKAMDIGNHFIKPLLPDAGLGSMDLMMGYSKIHSKFLKNIMHAAEEYNVDPRDIIVKLSRKGMLMVTKEMALDAARSLALSAHDVRIVKSPQLNELLSDVKTKNIDEVLGEIAAVMNSLSRKKKKQSIFTIAGSWESEREPRFPFIRESSNYIIGNAEVSTKEQASDVIRHMDGMVDFILVDNESRMPSTENLLELAERLAKKSKVLPYKDSEAWASSVSALITQLKESEKTKIAILGCNNVSVRVMLDLTERGFPVHVWDVDHEKLRLIADCLKSVKPEISGSISMDADKISAIRDCSVVIGFTYGTRSIDRDVVENMKEGGLIFDGSVGSVTRDAVKAAREMKIRIYRTDMRAALVGEISTVLGMYNFRKKMMGKRKIDDIDVISGGILGEKGDIVVDSVKDPKFLIGVADGHGFLLSDESGYEDRIKKVKLHILKKQFESCGL